MRLRKIQNYLQNLKDSNRTELAVLIDPDKADLPQLKALVSNADKMGVGLFLVGGSLLVSGLLEKTIEEINKLSDIPTVIFPGSINQISNNADAILFLSLISGRNPEYLIGTHVVAAPLIKKSGIEVLPTGYLLIDGGKPTTVSYMSNTFPIPHDKADIAACTAMAGEMLGLKNIFMDCGSGASKHVSAKMVAAVRKSVDLPIIVGGGIRTAEEVQALSAAGANLIVVGNAFEENPALLFEMAEATQQ